MLFAKDGTDPEVRGIDLNRILPQLKRDRIHLTEHNGQHSVPRHNHSFLELTYVLRGEVLHELDGKTETMTRGDYRIVDYGSVHSYCTAAPDGYDNLDCLFLPELIEPALKGTKSLRTLLEHYLLHFRPDALIQNPATIGFHDSDGEILRILRKIQDEMQNRRPGYSELARCYLIELLLLTMRNLEQTAPHDGDGTVTERMKEIIHRRYAEPITLREVAEELNYSPPYLSKRFKDDEGVTFVQYLQNYRVVQSCRLLSETRLSLSEIAEKSGYRDVKFFASLIRRYTGLSPSDFREKARSR